MKRFYFILLLTLVLAACQSAPATSVPTPSTLVAATPTHAAVSKGTSTPTVAPTPTGPVVHRSSSDPNASNLIVVKDQVIVHHSLTIDSIIAAKAGFIVLYVDKTTKPSHPQFGTIILSAAVPSGKSNQFVISLTQNLNPSIDPSALTGLKVDAVLQTNNSDPNSTVKINGNDVWVTFTILSKSKAPLLLTPTP